MSDMFPIPEQVRAMSGPELVTLHNRLLPDKPTRRFANRAVGVRRVLAALETASKAEEPSQSKREPTGKAIESSRLGRRSGVLRIPTVGDGKPPRPGSKRAAFLRLLQRPEGVTVAEARERFGWTARDVADAARLCAKSHGVAVRRNADGETWQVIEKTG